MKKQLLYIVAISLLTLGFSSCEKKSAGLTGTVDYVVLKLKGDSQIKLALGEPYVEPGFTATDKGKDVSESVEITIENVLGEKVDAVTTSSPGIFTITYSAVSEDKMYISESRQVFVFDPDLAVSIKGTFAVDFEKSKRVDSSKDWTWAQWSAQYTAPEAWQYASYSLKEIDIIFNELVPGIYEVNDYLGGFYFGLRGYGPYYKENVDASYYYYYAMGGMIVLNADLSLGLVSSYIPAWGDGLSDFSGTYDDNTKTIEFHSIYGGMDFNVVMVKK